MSYFKILFYSGWNPIFLMLAILTASIELYSLWYILGWEPYILIALIVCTIKSFVLLNNKGILGTVLAIILISITMFFSIQRPLSNILNSKSSNDKITYYNNLISRTKSEYDSLILDYKSQQNTYQIAKKDRAYGIIRDFNNNNILNNLSSKIEFKRQELEKYEKELIIFNNTNNNWYISLLILLIIVTVEILLVITSRKVVINKKSIEPPPIVKKKIIRKRNIKTNYLNSDI